MNLESWHYIAIIIGTGISALGLVAGLGIWMFKVWNIIMAIKTTGEATRSWFEGQLALFQEKVNGRLQSIHDKAEGSRDDRREIRDKIVELDKKIEREVEAIDRRIDDITEEFSELRKVVTEHHKPQR